MPFPVTCPNCGHVQTLDESRIGRFATCPACSRSLVVPAPEPEEEPNPFSTAESEDKTSAPHRNRRPDSWLPIALIGGAAIVLGLGAVGALIIYARLSKPPVAEQAKIDPPKADVQKIKPPEKSKERVGGPAHEFGPRGDGAITRERLVGTWMPKFATNDRWVFTEDGKCSNTSSGLTTTGTYELVGTKLTVKFPGREYTTNLILLNDAELVGDDGLVAAEGNRFLFFRVKSSG